VEGSGRVIVLRDGSVETELTGVLVDEEHLVAALAGDAVVEDLPEEVDA
jgi:galactofuranose transport system ATP-binding protein